MTFSLIFADRRTGTVGGAVHSHYPFVGATVLRARCGVGAALSQASGDAVLAEALLDEVEDGRSPQEAVARVVDRCDDPEFRQLAVVDVTGETAAHTGARCVPATATDRGDGVCAVGNMLVDASGIAAMTSAFCDADGDLPARLLAALRAGERCGGDLRGRQSAVVRITHSRQRWQDVDARVDDHADPLSELTRLVELRRRYGVLEDPDVVRGGPRLDEVLERSQREQWPEEVRFWLGMRLAAAGRAADVPASWRELVRRDPWLTLINRLREAGWETPPS